MEEGKEGEDKGERERELERDSARRVRIEESRLRKWEAGKERSIRGEGGREACRKDGGKGERASSPHRPNRWPPMSSEGDNFLTLSHWVQ